MQAKTFLPLVYLPSAAMASFLTRQPGGTATPFSGEGIALIAASHYWGKQHAYPNSVTVLPYPFLPKPKHAFLRHHLLYRLPLRRFMLIKPAVERDAPVGKDGDWSRVGGLEVAAGVVKEFVWIVLNY